MKIKEKRYFEMKEFDVVFKDYLPSELIKMACNPLFHRLHPYFVLSNGRLYSYASLEKVFEAHPGLQIN